MTEQNPNTKPDPGKVEEPTREDLITFARDCQKYYKEGQEIMRKHNLCINNLDDNMQKLAFTFYTDLCEIDSKACHLFQEGYGEDNYHDERLPAGVTYSPEHDNEIRNKALDTFMAAIENRFDDTNRGKGVVGTIRGLRDQLKGAP